MKPIFVYGTLKSTINVAYKDLDNFGWNLLTKREAQVSGNLHIIPCTNAIFPAVGKLNTENTITGEIIYINNPIFLQILDKIESEGVMYKRVTTTTTDGEECWLYQWHDPDKLEYLIEHGNFQYIMLKSKEEKMQLGIPMQAMDGNTCKVFIPELFAIANIDLHS